MVLLHRPQNFIERRNKYFSKFRKTRNTNNKINQSSRLQSNMLYIHILLLLQIAATVFMATPLYPYNLAIHNDAADNLRLTAIPTFNST